MAIVGSAYVEIHTITKSVAGEIRDGLQKAITGQGNETGKKYGDEFGKSSGQQIETSASKTAATITKTFEKAGDDAGKGFSSRFSGFMDRITSKAIKPKVDTSELDKKLDAAQEKLDKLVAQKNSPKLDLEIGSFTAKLDQVNARLADLQSQESSPKVDADIAAARANIAIIEAKLEELRRMKASTKIDVDIKKASADVDRLRDQIAIETNKKHTINLGIDGKSLTDSINGVAMLGRSLSMLALPIAITAAAPALFSLASSAVAASGALYLLPAALGGAGVAVGALVTGFSHLGDALGPTGTPAQIKKVNEALASLAPNARAVVGEIRALSGVWTELRLDVQQRMFEGLSAVIGPLAATYLPLLRASLGEAASGFNQAALGIANYLKSAEGADSVRVALANSGTAASLLFQAINPLGQAFFDIFAVGSGYVSNFMQVVLALSNEFAAYIARAKESGALNALIERGIEVFKQLGIIVGNVASIIGSAMSAAESAGSSTLSTIARLTGQIADFLNTDVGQSGLIAIFTGINDAVMGLTPGLFAVGKALAEAFIALGPAIGPVADAISAVAIALAPLIPHFVSLAVTILPPLAAILQFIAPLLGPLAAGFMAMMAIQKLHAVFTTVTTSMRMFAIAQGTLTGTAAMSAGPLAVLSGAIRGVGAAIAANPIGIIITVLVALVAAVIYAYNNFEGFRNVVDSVFGFVKDIALSIGSWFAGPFVDFFKNAFEWIKGVFNSVKDFFAEWGTVILAVIAPFIGIPLLIYQNWDKIAQFFSDLWNSILGVFSSMGTAIGDAATNAWEALKTGVSTAIDAVVNFFLDLPNKIAYALGFLVGSIVKFFTETGPAALDALVNGFWVVVDWFRALPGQIGTYLLGLAVTFAANAVAAWDGFTEGLGNAFDATVAWFQALPGNIATYLLGLAVSFTAWAIGAWDGFTAGLGTAFDATVAWFQALPGNISTYLLGLAVTFTANAIAAWDGFTAGLETAWDATIAWFQALPGNIGTFFSNAGSWLLSVGGDIIDGLLGGLTSAGNAVIDWFGGLVASFLQGFRDALGISSPSTVFLEFGVNILQGLLDGLKSLLGAVGSFIVSIGTAIIGFFQPAIDLIVGIWTNFWTNLSAIASTIFGAVQQVIQFVWAIIQALFQAAIALLTGNWSQFWAIIQAVGMAVWTAIQAYFSAALTVFQTIFTTVWNAISSVFSAVWNGIQTVATTVWGAIQSFITAGLDAISAVFTAIWNGIQAVVNAVWNAIRAFIEAEIRGLQAIWNAVWTAIQAVFSAIWNGIQVVATTVWNAITSFLQAGIAALQAIWTTVWNAISSFFSNIWAGIQGQATALWNAISSFLQAGINAFSSIWSNVWNAISSFFSGIWTAIQTIATTVWNAIQTFLAAAIAAFQAIWSNVWNAISSAFSSIWNAIKDTATSVWNAISSFFTGAINTFSSFWSNTWDSIKNTFGNVFGGIKDIATQIWGDVKGIFKTGLDAIIGGVNWPIEKINGLFGISIPTIPTVNLATGGDVAGKVKGLGGRRADRVPAALSYDEHVWTAQEVDGAGGHAGVRRLREMAKQGLLRGLADGGMVTRHDIPEFKPGSFIVQDHVASPAKRFLEALNNGQPEAIQATGGRFARMPRFAAGGALAAGQQFAQAQHGKPYIWGGVGPAGYDCSGFMSAITNVLRGKPPHSRLGVARSQPWSGFQSGLGSSFATGFSFEHTAGTLGGVNVEAGGSPSMTKYASQAAGATHGQFPGHAFLPEAGGVFVDGGGGGGIFDPASWFDSLASMVKQEAIDFIKMIVPDEPFPHFDPMAVDMFSRSWDGMRDTAINFIKKLFGLGGEADAPGASTADQTQAVAAFAQGGSPGEPARKQYGWDRGTEWSALSQLIRRESGFNESGQGGLFAKSKPIYGGQEGTAAAQTLWGLDYIKDQHGKPSKALARLNHVGHYDKGGWLQPGMTAAINGTGKQEAIIADPMTTFERSFKKVFKWFAPECRDALYDGSQNTKEWLRQYLSGFSTKNNGGATGGTKPTVPGTTIPGNTSTPPIVIPPIDIPPAPAPKLPIGDFGAAFNDALSMFAPDLALALKAGSGEQISEAAKAVLGNSDRMEAIRASLSETLGTNIPDITGPLQDFAKYVAQAPGQSSGGTGGTGLDPGDPMRPGSGTGNWLQDRINSLLSSILGGSTIDRGYNDKFAGSRDQVLADLSSKTGQSVSDIVSATPNLGNGTDPFIAFEQTVRERLGKIPALADELGKAFPDIVKAVNSSENDLRRVLGERSGDLLTYLNSRSQADADALLAALGSPAGTTDQLIASGSQAMTQAAQDAAPSNAQMTMEAGAFQVTIAGNADAVTVAQLQDTLSTWGEEILHQYEGRT